jgi:hypothetical protein
MGQLRVLHPGLDRSSIGVLDRGIIGDEQIVDGFADLNDNAERLFATPDQGLNR